jgi:hypothetical protein
MGHDRVEVVAEVGDLDALVRGNAGDVGLLERDGSRYAYRLTSKGIPAATRGGPARSPR